MKRLFFIYLLLIGFVGFAQQKDWSWVYLKSGSVIRGTILDTTENKLKLETYDKSIWVFKSDEIEKIDAAKKFKQSERIILKNKGLYNITTLGLMPGSSGYYYNNPTVYSVQTICGYQINKYLFAGVGVGYEKFNAAKLFPLFGEIRVEPINKHFSPFVTVQGGYALPYNESNVNDYYYTNKYFGGLLFNLDIGVRKYLTNNLALIAALGFRHQESTVEYTYNYYYDDSFSSKSTTKHIYNRLSFKVGLMLHG